MEKHGVQVRLIASAYLMRFAKRYKKGTVNAEAVSRTTERFADRGV